MRYVDEHKAAAVTGLSIKTLRNYRYQKREIPYVKIGASVRYRIKDLIDYMESNKVKVSKTT